MNVCACVCVLVSDSHRWKKRAVTGYRPNGRRSHCAVSVGTNVLFFGGYNAFHKQHFGDIFCLDTGMVCVCVCVCEGRVVSLV